MILHNGSQRELTGKDWSLLEMRSESTVERLLRELGLAMAKSSTPIEVFVPMDADRRLQMGEYLFCRSTNQAAISKLKAVRGIQGFVCSSKLIPSRSGDEPSVIEKPITVPDSEVQEMIVKFRSAYDQQKTRIRAGSFVRVIDGPAKNYCGSVIQVHNNRCTVKVLMLTKRITVETPVANVKDLSYVPKKLRVFFYCDAIQKLSDEHSGFDLPLPQIPR